MRFPNLLLALSVLAAAAGAEDAAKPAGDPALEHPTLHSLGVYWIVRGDDDADAQVALAWRKLGSEDWKHGLPLFRVERGAERGAKGVLKVPNDAWLFAGSVLLLEPDTSYELKLSLKDPDGGEAEKVLEARTKAEPLAPKDLKELHVVPGEGGGSGTKDDPYKGLAVADAKAVPGTLVVVHQGVYPEFTATRSGEPGKPIVWRGEKPGEAVIEGKGRKGDAEVSERAISAGDLHDVWFEDLVIRKAQYGIVAHRSWNMVVRRCRITHVDYGFTNTNNTGDKVRNCWLSDNLIEGPSSWPRTKGIESARGIQVTGEGHDVCYNRIRGFADGADTFPSVRCSAIDIHHNEISEMTDDGIEMDYSERNNRCFLNRLTNVYQGITNQPVFGGPVYIFRNSAYNLAGEPFKLHNGVSGSWMAHNTFVKRGMPNVTYGSERVGNCVSRNNLFIGTAGNYAYESTSRMAGCDFDFDGYGGGPWKQFLKWNGKRFDTLEDVKQGGAVYCNAVLVRVEGLFASGIKPPERSERPCEVSAHDLRLKEGSDAVDAGVGLPGLNDGFAGKAPDLGAYELGSDLPHYGPRR